MARVLGIAALVVVLDQATKVLALRELVPGIPRDVIEGFVSLTLVKNPGLAFGLLGGMPPGWRWLVGCLSIAALLVLVRVAIRVIPAGGVMGEGAIGLIFGGAVGNLIDRSRFGAVIDFIDVYVSRYHWPAFNVADSAITVGVVLLAVRLLVQQPATPGK